MSIKKIRVYPIFLLRSTPTKKTEIQNRLWRETYFSHETRTDIRIKAIFFLRRTQFSFAEPYWYFHKQQEMLFFLLKLPILSRDSNEDLIFRHINKKGFIISTSYFELRTRISVYQSYITRKINKTNISWDFLKQKRRRKKKERKSRDRELPSISVPDT